MKCLVCRDEGLEKGCPRCGKRYTPITLQPTIEKALGIPFQYQKDIVWDSSILLRDNPDKVGDTKFSNYVNLLDAIYKQACNGMLAKKSIMLISDRRNGKHTFIYCLMRVLKNSGYSVCQLIDHTDYLRISQAEVEKPWEKQEITMNDIIYSDFCALSVDNAYKYSALKAIQSILTKRGHAGKPTFIISDFSLSDLETKWNVSKDIRYHEGLDELRYCRVQRSY